MAAIRTTFGGSVSVNGALNVAGAISGAALSTGGAVINAISNDGTMASASDSRLPTYAAMKQYAATRDVATLAAANAYTDGRTGGSYVAPTTFSLLSPTDTVTFHNAVDDHTLTLSYDYDADEGLRLTASHPGDAAAPGFTASTNTNLYNAMFYGNILLEPGQFAWQVMQLQPRPVAGVIGPTMSQRGDWGTYLFPGTSDASYSCSIPAPFSAGTPATPAEMRLYIRYTMSASSSTVVKFRTTWQTVVPGSVIGAGATYDTDLTPTGAANILQYARLAVPLTTPTAQPAQLLFTFTRLGATDLNDANMSVWAISLVYNNAMWGAPLP